MEVAHHNPVVTFNPSMTLERAPVLLDNTNVDSGLQSPASQQNVQREGLCQASCAGHTAARASHGSTQLLNGKPGCVPSTGVREKSDNASNGWERPPA